MKQRLIQLVFGILRVWTAVIPTGFDKKIIVFLAKARSNHLPPKAGLQFLFEIDYGLYNQQKVVAKAYEGGFGLKYRLMQYHQFFIENVYENERVLDIGCGIGRIPYEIASHKDVKVVGIDLKEHWLDIARAEHSHPNIRYIHGDVLTDLPNEQFDTIIMSNVLEHLPNRTAFLQHVQTITKAKRFLIRVPMFDREWRVPLKKEVGAVWFLDTDHEIEFTLDSFQDETSAADLRLVSYHIRWGELYAVLETNNAIN